MKRLGAALTLSLLASCSPQRAPAPSSSAPVPLIVHTPVPGQAMSPRSYVTASSSFELFVLNAAQLAASRARTGGVRAHARAELADHRGLSAQLSFAGRGLNLLPPRAMWKSDAQRLAEIAASSDFDTVYKERMIAAHRHHLKVNRDFAARGSSPTLRLVARNAAPVIARHLDQLGKL